MRRMLKSKRTESKKIKLNYKYYLFYVTVGQVLQNGFLWVPSEGWWLMVRSQASVFNIEQVETETL